MANNVSRYLQNARLNWLRGTTYPAVPANVYIALLTTLPTDNNGTGIAEVSGGAYARQAVATATTSWPAPSTSGSLQQTNNTNAINFPTATANWGTIVGVAIYDAVTAGNLLYFGALTANQVVNNGNTFGFLVGQLTVQED